MRRFYAESDRVKAPHTFLDIASFVRGTSKNLTMRASKYNPIPTGDRDNTCPIYAKNGLVRSLF
jgi:hypothetical protein